MKKRVLITGAFGGIGSAVARTFAINNYFVIMHYNRNSQGVQYLKKLFTENGCECQTIKADVSKAEEVRRLAYEAGHIDILVNNAGIALTKQFTECTDDEIMRIMNVDLVSAMMLTKYILPSMITAKAGKIINISSIWGIAGASCEVAYSAAKAGMIGFTKALAKEVGPSGICVNCVAPGIIKTDMIKEYSVGELDLLARNTPLCRLGEPSDIASLVYYLASDKADFITGQIISPNGGFVI